MLTTLKTIAAYLIGNVDAFMYALFTFMILDFLTGIISAIFNKKFKPSQCSNGVLRKILVIVAIVVATVVDSVMGVGGNLRKIIISIFVFTEATSILSNIQECGVAIPSVLTVFIASAKSDSESTNIETKDSTEGTNG